MSDQKDSGFCPLCSSSQLTSLAQPFFQMCKTCGLVFKNSNLRPNPVEEKQRYRLHTNSLQDMGYLNFLKPVIEAVLLQQSPPDLGLDYGSGPSPVLATVLRDRGLEMDIHDPFFAPKVFLPQSNYDFVTCTETAEHFHSPAKEFKKIFGLSRKLFLMTEIYTAQTIFSEWTYARDTTHVSFYALPTLKWIAREFSREFTVLHPRLFLFS